MAPSAPYLLLGEARSRALREQLLQCSEDWQRHWFGHASLLELATTTLVESQWSGALSVLFGDATFEPVLQLGATTEFIPRLLGLQAMSAPAAAAGMSAELARSLQLEMLQQLGEAVLRVAQVSGPVHPAAADADAVLPSGETRRWLHATFTQPHSFERLVLLIHPSVVVGLVPQQAPIAPATLVSRRTAIGAESVCVEAWLGEVQLTLRDFASLRTGDVLVLEGSEPAYLTAYDRQRIATLHPGRQRQRRAVSIGAVLQQPPVRAASHPSTLHTLKGS